MYQFTSYPVQDNYDTSQSCSRGVCLRSCWISTSGRGRKPSTSARSSWPCWSCCQRKEPQLPSVWNTPGSPPRHTSSVLFRAQRTSRLGHIARDSGLRQLWDVQSGAGIMSTAFKNSYDGDINEWQPFPCWVAWSLSIVIIVVYQ